MLFTIDLASELESDHVGDPDEEEEDDDEEEDDELNEHRDS